MNRSLFSNVRFVPVFIITAAIVVLGVAAFSFGMAFAAPVSVFSDFAIFGAGNAADSNTTTIGANVTVTSGLTGGNRHVTVGANATLSGIRSGKTTTLGAGVTTGGLLQNASTITLPTPSTYTAATGASADRTVATNGTLTLAPGTYRNLSIGTNATLNLSAGTYTFNTITTNANSTLHINVGSGNVTVFAAGNVSIGTNSNVTIAGGSASAFYLETAGTFTTGANDTWRGTVYSTKSSSPAANGITIGNNNAITGALYSNEQVSIGNNSTVASNVATAILPPPIAACLPSSTFDTFVLGSVNGQGGWAVTNPSFDQDVVSNTYGFPTFGCQTLRISDSITSGTFGDQLFSPSITNEAGEADALNGGFSGGVRQNHFEAQFDLASAQPLGLQPGMHISVSPDRGDGARMSYLRFEDHSASDTYTADTAIPGHPAGSHYDEGINVFFDDVTASGACAPAGCIPFNEIEIATLDRSVPHTIKFVMDFVDGPSNDVVKIYIDGTLVHTGTSWENYYRFDPESQSGPSDVNKSRTVDSLLFRESGDADIGNVSKGFLLDNFSLNSSTVNGNLVINKYSCPIGTTVTRVDNGVGGTVPAGCVPQAGATFGYVHGTQTDANAPYPELSQTFTALTTTDVSGVSTTSLPATGRYLVAETDANGNQLAANAVVGLYCTGDGDTSGNNDNQELTFVSPNGDVHCVSYDQATLSAPTPVSPADGTVTTTAAQQLVDWSDVGADDSFQPIVYFYQVSNDPATSTDGSFVNSIATIPTGTDSQIATPNTPDGVYYWHVYAQDNNGNKSPWSITQKIVVDNTPAPTASVTTDTAQNVTASDATLEATNGGLDAGGHSFWISTTANIDTSTSNIPSGVYSTPDLGAVTASTDFAAQLSLATTNGVPGNMPAIQPNTTYYYVAWVNVGGTWYHGVEQSFETTDGPIPPTPSVTTEPPTGQSTSDATLNGMVGPVGADSESFWVSDSTINTSSPNIPAGVYSTPVLAAVGANGTFSDPLSLVTTNGIITGGAPGNHAAITPATTYHYVAWAHINGTWYPGADTTVTTLSTAAPVITNEALTVNSSTSVTITWDTDHNSTSRVVYGTTPVADDSTSSCKSPDTTTHGCYGYSNSTDETNTPADTNGVTSHSVTITGLTAGTTYYFRPVSEGSPEAEGSELSTGATATPQTVSVSENGSTPITLAGTGPAGDTLTFATSSSPANGALSGTSPNLTYTPNVNSTASDSFTFTVTDTTTGITSDPATVTINVGEGSPVLPVANAQSVTTNNADAATVTLSGSGGAGSLTYVVDSSPMHGALSGTAPNLTYTPSPFYVGPDSFTFYVTDSSNVSSDDATVSITDGDTIPPVITLNGDNPANITVGDTYSDPGAVVTDNMSEVDLGYQFSVDGGATSTAPGDSPVIDTTVPGTHSIFYIATDGSGNVSATSTRTVVVSAVVTSPVTPSESSGGGGGGGGGGVISGNFAFGAVNTNPTSGGGIVLGTSTGPVITGDEPLPTGCSALLTEYLGMGKKNDPAQVKLLQNFLNGNLGTNLPITGFFGSMTTAAVKQFQLKYASVILAPWGLTEPTGYVYKLTEYEINLNSCSTLNAPVPDITNG